MTRPKSTTPERIAAWLCSSGAIGSALAYTFVGGRGWVFAVVINLVMLIAVVAGVAER